MTATLEDLLKEVESMNVVVDFPELRVADRCDHGGCSAQAFVITMHIKGLLYWCKHHFERHQVALVSSADDKKAIAIHDGRDSINKTPTVQASS